MPRAALPSGRKFLLLLLALATAIIGGAWWWQCPPPEPVFEGRRISEVVFDPEEVRTRNGDPNRLLPFGPDGVRWLAYEVEHGRGAFKRHGPLPFDHAPDWLRRGMPDRWGGLRATSLVDERVEAIIALDAFGTKAEPAIPILAKCLMEGDDDLVGNAGWLLDRIGPMTWPVVHEALQHGSATARRALLARMDARVGDKDEPAPDAEVALVAEVLAKGCGDPDANVRRWTVEAILGCRHRRPDTALLSPVIPALIPLLSDSSPEVRRIAAVAMRVYAVKEGPVIERLRAMLHDNDNCAAAAWYTLKEFGLAPEEANTSADALQTR